MTSRDTQSLGNLAAQLSSQASELVRAEVALAKASFAEKAKNNGLGVALLAGAAVIGFFVTGLLILAIVYAFGNLVPMWAAYLITAAIGLAMIVALIAVGVKLFKRSSQIPPATARISGDIAHVRANFSFERRVDPDAENKTDDAKPSKMKAREAAKAKAQHIREAVEHAVANAEGTAKEKRAKIKEAVRAAVKHAEESDTNVGDDAPAQEDAK